MTITSWFAGLFSGFALRDRRGAQKSGPASALVSDTVALTSDSALQIAAVTLVTGVYYTAVRVIESRYPKLGFLLGWKAKPNYDQPPAG